MAKARTAYVCSECGASANKWQGQCGECGAWNTMSEIVVDTAPGKIGPASRQGSWAGRVDAPRVTALAGVTQTMEARVSTRIGELDRVRVNSFGTERAAGTRLVALHEADPILHDLQ